MSILFDINLNENEEEKITNNSTCLSFFFEPIVDLIAGKGERARKKNSF
jgi:hypothetical protein